jgi:DNA-binding NtrC family response regulator
MPLHIFLVDDDEATRYAYGKALQAADYVVHAFPDYRGVTELLDRGAQADLLIVDVILPKGTPHGVALAAMARTHRPALPVLYMTGHPDVAPDIPSGRTLLMKPISPEQLLHAVAQAVKPPA